MRSSSSLSVVDDYTFFSVGDLVSLALILLRLVCGLPPDRVDVWCSFRHGDRQVWTSSPYFYVC
jgi:hypothetical protein